MRKIVQIACADTTGTECDIPTARNTGSTLHALCDDGTLWSRWWDPARSEWSEWSLHRCVPQTDPEDFPHVI